MKAPLEPPAKLSQLQEVIWKYMFVVARPIIIVSTINKEGIHNAALKKPVKVELEKSIGLGDKVCKFVIYL